MKKKIFYATFLLLVITAGGAVWYFTADKTPPPDTEKAARKKPTKREYTQADRKHILTAMIEKNPELWRERYILGGLYLQEMDFDKAIEQFKTIIKIRPKMVRAYNALGMCYLNLGNNDKAVAVWKKALEIYPDNDSARDLIARTQGTEERTGRRRKLEVGLEKDPDQPQNWFELGEIYLKEKLYDRAMSALRKASELEPERADYLYQLGYTFHITRDYNQAEQALSAALVLDPQNEKIKRLLSDTQAKKTVSPQNH